MQINFFVNNSDPKVINKNITAGLSLDGYLKEECSIINPMIMIETDESVINYNYLYIPTFNRYYYISDITSVHNNLFRITCNVDPLMSFKDQIMNLPVILDDTQSVNSDYYIDSEVWKTKVKTLTDIIAFPNGLNDNGEFILITAGG